jgi:hypothetical protein
MHKLLKTLHLLGFGASFGGIIASLVGGAQIGVIGPVIVSGLAVSGLSGVAMMVRAGLSPIRQRWLFAHLAAASLAALSATSVATPASKMLSEVSVVTFAAACACLLALTIASGVFKPRFGKSRSQ